MLQERELLLPAGCSRQACGGWAKGQPLGLPDRSPPWEVGLATRRASGCPESNALRERGGPGGCGKTKREGATRLPGAGAVEGAERTSRPPDVRD